jgi:hypothetical protein
MNEHTRTLINPKWANRIAQLAGMFGSHRDGEVINAARIADRLIRDCGLRWSDVIAQPPAEWQAMAAFCSRPRSELTEREADFISNIGRLRRQPSDRQLEWLEAIFERLNGAECEP